MNSICKNQTDTIDYGDMVILYTDDKLMVEVKIKEGSEYANHNGVFKHSAIVGKRFGTKLYSETMRGYVYLLKTSSTMHTLWLRHRTQILYAPDISMVLLQLDIKCGSTVIESGTGSGSLSTSIAKTLLPAGHLYTFEFNKERVRIAKEEFEDMGLEKFITVTYRDVLQDGFKLETEESDYLDDKSDAVFLDLPSPWKAVKHAHKVLRHNGRLCNFSPCIEQVQKVWMLLHKLKFSHIRTIECLSQVYTSQNRGYKHLNYSDDEFDNDSEEEKQDGKNSKSKIF